MERRDSGMWRLKMGECEEEIWKNAVIKGGRMQRGEMGECGEERWENAEIRDGRICARLEMGEYAQD